MKHNFAFILIGVFISITTININAQEHAWLDEPTPVYEFDFLSFKSNEPGKTYVEVFCHVPTSNLQFIKTGESYIASFEVSISFFDKNNINVANDVFSDWVEVPTFKDIDLQRAANSSRFVFLLEPGIYIAEIIITDLETSAFTTLNREVNVLGFEKDSTSISELQLASLIRPSLEDGYLVKSGLEVIPNITGIFDRKDSLFPYVEFYVHDASNWIVAYKIKDKSGQFVKGGSNRLGHIVGEQAVYFELPLASLSVGGYDLQFEIYKENGQTGFERQKHFTVVEGGMEVVVLELK